LNPEPIVPKEMNMASRAKIVTGPELRQAGTEVEERDHSVPSTPEQEIRCRAYEIYLERGAQPGGDVEDWLQAERELTTNQ
jgi:hypothetical protein